MKKRILFALLACLLAVSSLYLPAYARIEAEYNTPSGYNDNDYQKLVAFFETADGSGVKNGKKLSPSYSPSDPSTWTNIGTVDGVQTTIGVNWVTSGGKKRASEIILQGLGMVGELNVGGCSALTEIECEHNALTKIELSGCSALEYLYFTDNQVTSINVSPCPQLWALFCGENRLSALNISSNPNIGSLSCEGNSLSSLNVSNLYSLRFLDCGDNSLSALNVSNCPDLMLLNCAGNRLKSLDLRNNSMLYFSTVTANGSGTIGHTHGSNGYDFVSASPDPGYSFLGWYTQSGELVSRDRELSESGYPARNVVARFGEAVPGDANGDGTVDTTDALLILRCALGISGSADELLANCDMDGNGTIDTTDALIVLRMALNIG